MNSSQRELFETHVQENIAKLPVKRVRKLNNRYATYENYEATGYSLWHKLKTAVRVGYWRLTLPTGRWVKVELSTGSKVFYFWDGRGFNTKTRPLKDHYHINRLVEVLNDWYIDGSTENTDHD